MILIEVLMILIEVLIKFLLSVVLASSSLLWIFCEVLVMSALLVTFVVVVGVVPQLHSHLPLPSWAGRGAFALSGISGSL